MRIAIIERLLSRSENQMGDNWVVVFGESSGRGDTRQGETISESTRRVFARAALAALAIQGALSELPGSIGPLGRLGSS
jgi:hypothetical protein